MRTLLIFLISILPFIVNGQSIKGYVMNETNNEPLVAVNVYIDGTTIGTATNELGFFELDIDRLPIVVTVSYLGFESRKISIINLPEDTLRISLSPISSLLPETVITAKPKVDTVYRELYSVVDYEFFDSYILLLVYRGLREKYSIVLTDRDGKALSEEPVGRINPVGFYKGCLGAVHFLTGIAARQIYIQDEKIYFYKPVQLKLFERTMYPCILKSNDYVYFKNDYVRGQVIHYYRTHVSDTTNTKESFAVVKDEERAMMAVTEDRFQSIVNNLEQYASRKISAGEQLSNAGFVGRVVFEPLYVPIYPHEDTMLIFNHRSHQIEFYAAPEVLSKTVHIEYSENKKWIKQIIPDEETQTYYTLSHSKKGYTVQYIDIQTGKTRDIMELKRVFIDKIKIKSGYLYFLENDFRGGDRIIKLQRVRIW